MVAMTITSCCLNAASLPEFLSMYVSRYVDSPSLECVSAGTHALGAARYDHPLEVRCARTHGPLRTAQGREEGDTLVIEVAPDFAALAAIHVDEYRELARTASGRALKVRIGAAANAEPPAASPAEVNRRRMADDAVRAPAVQEALDLFNGKVLEVRDTKPAKEGP